MQEAAEKVGVDFNINVVTDEHHQIIEIVAGELLASWQQGVETCKQIYLCPIEKKAEVVIASTGGYPKDINVYQAQKALDNALLGGQTGRDHYTPYRMFRGLQRAYFWKMDRRGKYSG